MNMWWKKAVPPIYTEHELEEWFAPPVVVFTCNDAPEELAALLDKWVDETLSIWTACQREEAVMLLTELGRGEG